MNVGSALQKMSWDRDQAPIGDETADRTRTLVNEWRRRLEILSLEIREGASFTPGEFDKMLKIASSGSSWLYTISS